MIEGLHFDLTHDELQDHLMLKAGYHAGREQWYQDRITDLKDGGVMDDQQVSGGSPLSNLEHQAKKHGERSSFFLFLADHLVNDTYRLSENDLRTLELIGRHF